MLTFNFKKISPSQDSFMLDVGCGKGRHIFGFMDVHANVNCVGIDLDLPSIIESKKNLTLFSSISNKESNFLQGSLYHLPFNDQTFETIICSEVLEHVSDVESALNEIDRLLKPGGKLLISVPSFLPEKICWLLSKDYQEMPGGHVRIFKKNILKNLVTKRGYIYLNSEKFHALHSPYWWLRCLFWDTQDTNFLVKQYKKILELQILKSTPILNFIDKILNPIIGKSSAFYFQKK